MEPNFADLKPGQSPITDSTAREISKGQKAVIGAFLLNFFAVALVEVLANLDVSQSTRGTMVVTSWVLQLTAVVLGLFGLFKIASELGWPGLTKVVIFICLLIPVVNLITLLVINGKATTYLKKAGYKVGLAGAYK